MADPAVSGASRSPAAPDTSAPLSEGDSGSAVRALQRKVGATPDGIFGPSTESAVERYQRAHHLHVDGIVGPQTARSLATPAHVAARAQGPVPVPRPGHSPTQAPVPPAPAATPAGTTNGSTTEQRWDGWSDAKRGANVNLGDTESALHLFYDAHPELAGRPPAEGTKEAAQLSDLHLSAAAARFAAEPDPAETNWSHSDSRSVTITDADRDAAWSIYAGQHPELGGKKPVAGTPAAADLHGFERYVAQNRYNATIDHALVVHPTTGIDAKDLKSLLIEESGFNPDVGSNRYGYTGIAQLGPDLAGKAMANDPLAAIPIAAETLHNKAHYLDRHAFKTYGQPVDSDDRTRFILGAYNGGEGTIQNALEGAHGDGVTRARAAHLSGKAADAAADEYATRWDSILAPASDPAQSPLYDAIPPAWGKAAKYREIGSYATDIVERAKQ